MSRFSASLLFLIASACGGEVGVGTLATDPHGDTPGSCPSGSSVEVLYTSDRIVDFVGNGSAVIAVAYSADGTSADIVRLPASSPEVRSVKTTNGVIPSVAAARSRFFYGDGDWMASEAWSGWDSEQTSLNAPAAHLTSHPERDNVVYFVETAPDSTQPAVWSLTFGGEKANLEMSGLAGFVVDSLAVSPSGFVALIDNVVFDGNSYKLVRPPAMHGGGPYEVVADLRSPVSNVALDGNASFVASLANDERKVIIYRYEGKDMKPDDGTIIGSFDVEPVPGRQTREHIEIDGDWVYVSAAAKADACDDANCKQQFAMLRFKKDGSDADKSTPASLKSFVGPAALRPFAIDACYLIWYDKADGKLYRQPKASL